MSKEELAKVIYWACYTQPCYLRPGETHSHTHQYLTKDAAWDKTSPGHRDLCRWQAEEVINYIKENNI